MVALINKALVNRLDWDDIMAKEKQFTEGKIETGRSARDEKSSIRSTRSKGRKSSIASSADKHMT